MRPFYEALEPIGHALGSNPGGLHKDSRTGEKYYLKKPKNTEQAKTEVLVGKIYKHMGIHTTHADMHKDHVKSKWNDHLEHLPHDYYKKPSKEHAKQLGKMYHAAVLTKNWDIAGLDAGSSNIMHDKKTGHLVSIDHGGSMHFRAQGAHKDYDHGIGEKHTLRDTKHFSGHVFHHAFKEHPEAEHHGLEAVKKINDHVIHHLFRTSGLKDWKAHHEAFKNRKKALLDSYK